VGGVDCWAAEQVVFEDGTSTVYAARTTLHTPTNFQRMEMALLGEKFRRLNVHGPWQRFNKPFDYADWRERQSAERILHDLETAAGEKLGSHRLEGRHGMSATKTLWLLEKASRLHHEYGPHVADMRWRAKRETRERRAEPARPAASQPGAFGHWQREAEAPVAPCTRRPLRRASCGTSITTRTPSIRATRARRTSWWCRARPASASGCPCRSPSLGGAAHRGRPLEPEPRGSRDPRVPGGSHGAAVGHERLPVPHAANLTLVRRGRQGALQLDGRAVQGDGGRRGPGARGVRTRPWPDGRHADQHGFARREVPSHRHARALAAHVVDYAKWEDRCLAENTLRDMETAAGHSLRVEDVRALHKWSWEKIHWLMTRSGRFDSDNFQMCKLLLKARSERWNAAA